VLDYDWVLTDEGGGRACRDRDPDQWSTLLPTLLSTLLSHLLLAGGGLLGELFLSQWDGLRRQVRCREILRLDILSLEILLLDVLLRKVRLREVMGLKGLS